MKCRLKDTGKVSRKSGQKESSKGLFKNVWMQDQESYKH
jgi:hypothetical protein